MLAGKRWICALAFVALSVSMVFGARVRPGADPRPDRVIWADQFDNYSQWASDNQSEPAYQPRGTLWQGGPTPSGDLYGTYPWKSPDDSGCGVTGQYPGFALARAQWVSNDCPSPIVTPAGYSVVAPTTLWAEVDAFVPGTNCTSGGCVETISMFGRYDGVWQTAASWHSPLGMFTHDLAPRIQNWSELRAWDESNPNAVNGTDEHPLTLIFYLHDSGSPANPRALQNNSYVELNLDDEYAPTDYIWRGDHTLPYPEPECCPEGPYPIICQQVREVNSGNYEGIADLDYLNDHCPLLVPPYDPQTQTGKTWSAIAFGFLAITCKDPCTCEEQGEGSHRPVMNHPLLFNGNVWQELRSGRGTALTQCPPDWGTEDPEWGWATAGPETTMQDSGGGACGNYSLAGGTHIVYLKLTTTKIMIWMHNVNGDYCGAFDRVYQGPFNRIAWGVGPGCELKDKATEGDEYACKPGGTPTQCLTYSSGTADGFWRNNLDSMSLLDGILVHHTYYGACCIPDDGSCVPDQPQDDCEEVLGGAWRGMGSTCEGENDELCCVDPFADADHDKDVDQADFGIWQACFSGDGNAHPDTKECKCFNHDGGSPGDVDDTDFNAFQACWSGPAVDADTSCDGAYE